MANLLCRRNVRWLVGVGLPQVSRPLLLDLYSCAGGCSLGYYQAGFEPVGVDLNPQPNYQWEFHQSDALEFLRTADLSRFSAIHASPPCQHYTQSTLGWRNQGKQYPDLLAPTREALQAIGLPWVIENVPNAPMRADFLLCGSQFGLQLVRHRLFEVSWGPLVDPILMPPCSHHRLALTVTGRGTPSYVRKSREKAGIMKNYTLDEVRRVMEIPHASRLELSQAIPPAYTRFIGKYLMEQVMEREDAA